MSAPSKHCSKKPPLGMVRMAVARFFNPPRKWKSWNWNVGLVSVESITPFEGDGATILLAARLELDEILTVDSENRILVPERPRQLAEGALEAACDAVAVAEGCGRSILSPVPCIAFVTDSRDALEWLNASNGVPVGDEIEVDTAAALLPEEMNRLGDRMDGVALLAEALSHNHACGRLRELLRLFERAFALSGKALVRALTTFLEGAHLGYEKTEISEWDKLRNLTTHGDRASRVVLESSARPVLSRVLQAAYDVLFNKESWHTADVHRRAIWVPTAWTLSPRGQLWIKQRSAPTMHVQPLDAFRSYPMNTHFRVANHLPDGWWTGPLPETHSFQVRHIVSRHSPGPELDRVARDRHAQPTFPTAHAAHTPKR